MNNGWKTWLMTGFLLVSASAAGDGFDGHHRSHGDFGDPDRLVEHMTRRLELDDTQAQTLQNIVDASRPEIIELRDRAMKNHQAIRELAADDPEFDTKLSLLAQDNGELATAATLLHGRLRAELNAVLTPEQRAVLAEMPPRWGRRGPREAQ